MGTPIDMGTHGSTTASGGGALVADMPAADGYRLVLLGLADTATRHLPGAIAGSDPVHLHQLRVAVRRSRAVLADVRPVLRARSVGEVRDGLARVGRATGPARDLDVHVGSWAKDIEGIGDDAERLEPATGLLRAKREQAQREMIDELRSEHTSALFERWHDLLRDDWSTAVAKGGNRALGTVVARRVLTAHRVVLEHGRTIDGRSPATDLHDLRKDVKAVRYLVDCFAGLTDDRARRRYAKRLRRLQAALGEHQDADVHLIAVERIAAELHADAASAPTLLALGRMTERLVQRRAAARARFAVEWAGFDDGTTEERLDVVLGSLRAGM